GALLHGYAALHCSEYLDAARSAADFILSDLPILYEDEEARCIGYVPDLSVQFRVININALAAALLAEVGAATREQELLEPARKLMTFVARHRTAHGAWHYTVDPRQSLVTHDNYHTGMILDSLLAYESTTGDSAFRSDFDVGLDFYHRQLFLPDGAPKW